MLAGAMVDRHCLAALTYTQAIKVTSSTNSDQKLAARRGIPDWEHSDLYLPDYGTDVDVAAT